jgi:hypothetical protein
MFFPYLFLRARTARHHAGSLNSPFTGTDAERNPTAQLLWTADRLSILEDNRMRLEMHGSFPSGTLDFSGIHLCYDTDRNRL